MAGRIFNWFKREKWGVLVVLLLLAAAVGLRLFLGSEKRVLPEGDYVEYEKGVIVEVLSDSTQKDEAADGAYRGEQMMTVEVKTGQYKGQTLLVYNYVGPIYGVPLGAGQGVSLSISTYKDGSHRATVFEFDRVPWLIAVVLLFFAVTALVGGKTGLKSFVGLVFTVFALFLLLIPLLLRGAPTVPTVFCTCAFVAAMSFTVLGGVHRKTVCAFLGTVAGTALALAFGLLAQTLTKVNGLRTADVEPLLQLRQSGTPIGLKGLLLAGIVVSALGAVMDVSMSVSSALEEIRAANPALGAKELFRSGMNVGRDMVGTMTNTLILAFLGSGFTMILYLSSLGLTFWQLFTSAWVSVELVSGVSASVGMILAIPLTAAISAGMMNKKKK